MNCVPGVEIEDKGRSVAIHYRNASPRSFRMEYGGIAPEQTAAKARGGTA